MVPNMTTKFLLFFLLLSASVLGQDSKIIEIRKTGSSTQDELQFPGANILLRDKTTRSTVPRRSIGGVETIVILPR